MTRIPADTLHLALVQGQKYQLKYKYQAANYRWVERYAVVKFIDSTRGDGGRQLFFSGRPEFGDFTLGPKDILAVKTVPNSTKCYSDRKTPQRT